MERMFYQLNALKTFYVKYMDYMFYGSTSITSINLNSFYTENVEDIAYMFSSCYSSRYLDVSDFETKNVERMAGMSNDCSKKVENYEGIFYNCDNLHRVDISSFHFDHKVTIFEKLALSAAVVIINEKIKNFIIGKVPDKWIIITKNN